MVDNFSDWNCLLNLNYFLAESFNSLDLGYFLDDFNDAILESRNFNDFLIVSFHLHYFILDAVDNNWHFDRNWHSDLNLDYLLNFNNLLYYLFNSHNLRYFNYSLDYLLDYLFNLYDLGDNSEDFKNIIYIDNAHNLLID